MKKSQFRLLLLLIVFSSFVACNNEKTAAEQKVLDIPATTASDAAKASFTEGLACLDNGDGEQAKILFTKAITADPKLAIAYVFRANTAQSAKEFADNMNMAKTNLDSASEFEKMYYEYNATFLTNDWNKRLEILQKMTTNYPDAARLQADLGNTYLTDKQEAKAKECFEKAIEKDPKWTGGYTNLSFFYLFSTSKDLKKAEENALKVVELAPKSPGAEITLGDCYRAQNDMQKARDAYAKAVQLDPASSAGYYKKGHANSYLGNYDEARNDFMEADKHGEGGFAGIFFIGNTYLYAGDNKMAMQYLESKLPVIESSGQSKEKISQGKLNVLNSMADIAMYTGDAAKLKETVAKMEPLVMEIGNDIGTEEAKLVQKGTALYWQAATEAVAGNFDAAKAKAEEIKTTLQPVKDPTNLNGYNFLLGYINLKQNKNTEAVGFFEKSDPVNNIYNKYWLAMANEAAGNKDKAKAMYKEVAEFNFNSTQYALVRNEAKKKAG